MAVIFYTLMLIALRSGDGEDVNGPCPRGRYRVGGMCSGVCHCQIVSQCNTTDGRCMLGGCLPNWNGSSCQECRGGRFGQDCQKHCHCKVPLTCDAESGSCGKDGCAEGWTGAACQEKSGPKSPECPTGRFLVNGECNGVCGCEIEHSCRVSDGRCLFGGCKPNRTGTDCQQCVRGIFGSDCAKICHCREKTECLSDGQCLSGCDVRYTGKTCQRQCKPGIYLILDRCEGECHCLIESQCRITDGVCMNQQCKNGRTGSKCQHCPAGSFGPSCKKTCRCRDHQPCDHGVCKNGCDRRYYGQHCENSCIDGFFLIGSQCLGVCKCAIPAQCNATDGTCGSGGCRKRHHGPQCQQCNPNDRTFGEKCDKPCHCKNNAMCATNDGSCPGGCDTQHYGASCQKRCTVGQFAKDGACTGKCHCATLSLCNAADGKCLDGKCQKRWAGKNCQDCAAGRYGRKCNQRCFCNEATACSRRGYCFDGCDARHYGRNCQKECPQGRYLIMSSCDGVCRCSNPSQCRVTDGVCLDAACVHGRTGQKCQLCLNGKSGATCSRDCNCAKKTDCERNKGLCSSGCVSGYIGDFCEIQASTTVAYKSANVALVVGIILGVVVFSVVLVGIILYCQWRWKKSAYYHDERSNSISGYDGDPDESTIGYLDTRGPIADSGNAQTPMAPSYAPNLADRDDTVTDDRDWRIQQKVNKLRANQRLLFADKFTPTHNYSITKPPGYARPQGRSESFPYNQSPIRRYSNPASNYYDNAPYSHRPSHTLRQSRFYAPHEHQAISQRLADIVCRHDDTAVNYSRTLPPLHTKNIADVIHNTAQSLRECTRDTGTIRVPDRHPTSRWYSRIRDSATDMPYRQETIPRHPYNHIQLSNAK